MADLKITGGAYVGKSRATWPFAKLTVNDHMLELNTGIIGKFVFRPSEIVTIRPYDGFAGFVNGVEIVHTVQSYKERIVFTSSKGVNEVIRLIKQTGFLDNKDKQGLIYDYDIDALRASGSFPLKTIPTVVIVVIWNLLFFIDFTGIIKSELPVNSFYSGRNLAITYMLVLALLMLVFKPLSSLILKEGRTVADIMPFLLFLLFILSILLAGSLLAPVN